jgi:hypothetical protein
MVVLAGCFGGSLCLAFIPDHERYKFPHPAMCLILIGERDTSLAYPHKSQKEKEKKEHIHLKLYL